MKAFLITPFTAERAGETAEVFEAVQRAIAEAAQRAGVELLHPARINRAGAIMQQQVEPAIEEADVVLALITGQNPNVFFELGFARREAILICRSSKDVPFDVQHDRYWTYGTPQELASLPERLADAIRQTLAASERSARRQRVNRSPLTCVETVAAFVGPTERGPTVPTLVTGPADCLATFGNPLAPDESYLAATVEGFFANGGTRAYVARVVSPLACRARATVSEGREGEIDTGTLVIEARSAGAWGNRIEANLRAGTRTGWRLTVVCQPGSAEGKREEEDYDNCSLDPRGPNPLVGRINDRSGIVRLTWLGFEPASLRPGRFTLTGGADGPRLTAADFAGTGAGSGAEPTGLEAIAALDDVDLVCVPDHVHPALPLDDQQLIADAVVALCERSRDRLALLATPAGEHGPGVLKPRHDTWFAATYYPWLRTSAGSLVPPIGHVAGALARNDRERGVHWAPLDLVLEGVAKPALACEASAEQRDTLERLGINVLASDRESDRPVTVTAYTLAVEEESRYMNAIRFTSFMRRRLVRGLAWVVFEKNEPSVWQRIETEVRAFLSTLWEDGILAERPEDAFFVRCDRTTMTEDDINNGRIVLLVGTALRVPVPLPLEPLVLRAGPPSG